MSIVFESFENEITLEQETLNDNAATLKESREKIVSEFVKVTEQDQQLQAGYRGNSRGAYQTAMDTLYGRCRSLAEIQLEYAEELEYLAIESANINEEAEKQAGTEGIEE